MLSRMRHWIAISLLIFCSYRAAVAQAPPENSARKIADRVATVYPELARKLNLEGIVRLRVTVAPDGTAKFIQVQGGNPILVKAAQDAVIRWKWVPAPQETREIVELRFHPRLLSAQ
jgi:TonB family protein